ncbi:MAG: asparagine synthase (glutamine-hydrolyzing) [Chitinispirillaceae bacterium]|nr:asparagine synthase (glutamine-hydrolyzing) [Chitinispirillaceae bacterium]
MCGITGIFSPSGLSETDRNAIYPMTSMLSHRGPDEQGFYTSEAVLLGHRRLSIIDLSGGKQPMANEDGTVWIVFNGELFNYVELRDILINKGHRFSTRSDTEVFVHLYEQYGNDLFRYCNGQFSVALWDTKKKQLLLARDHVGICPLYYVRLPGKKILFSSEVKSLFCHGEVSPRINPAGLDQIFSLWVTIPPETVFDGVEELAPGTFLKIDFSGEITCSEYWKPQFPSVKEYEDLSLDQYASRLRELLCDAAKIRLRADVPVAAYLSGGIDSSVISAIVKKYHINDLITFSVAFKDQQFDEQKYQMAMVRHLQTDHRTVLADYTSIGDAFSDVIWYAEKPMIRTAPSPLFHLSRLVRSNGLKVVLTGEGADEILGGYDIFKEALIRHFWSRQPQSTYRPQLFTRIYPDIVRKGSTSKFWQSFFRYKLEDADNPYYSHLIRWNNTSQIKAVFSNQYREMFNEQDNILKPLQRYIDPEIVRWHPLCAAQYLEMKLFLSGYLLSSQGDRMLMANSIEGRFPFLDPRVIEFAATIPPRYKMMGLKEKFVLKHTFQDLLPPEIVNRSKQPYRSPIHQCFLGHNRASMLLSRDAIEQYGYFDPAAVEKLTGKMKSGLRLSERENMAVVGVVSTQLLHEQFVRREWRKGKGEGGRGKE